MQETARVKIYCKGGRLGAPELEPKVEMPCRTIARDFQLTQSVSPRLAQIFKLFRFRYLSLYLWIQQSENGKQKCV